MAQSKLKTAILGLNNDGQSFLEAVWKSGCFEIVAVGDTDSKLAEQFSRKYECKSFDDYRQLIIQSQLDVLFIAAPLYVCDEHIHSALKKKFNVVKIGPPGFDFEQAAEFVRAARREGVIYFSAKPERFSPGFSRLSEYMSSGDKGPFNLITAVFRDPKKLDDADQRWLTDPQLAGGGVLLRDCYSLIDQIVLNFGICQQVYALNTNRAPDRQQRLSRTEDTSILSMKFTDTLIADLIATRAFGPPERFLRLHTNEQYVTVTENSFVICDNSGNVLEQFLYRETAEQWLARMLQDLTARFTEPEKYNPTVLAAGDIGIMAVIESAYLSARTAMPEQPARILGLAGGEIATIWNLLDKRIS